MKTTVVVSDLQIPFQDRLALKKTLQVISDMQPDAVVQIGDLIDAPQVSQWTKHGAGEYALTLQRHIDEVKDSFFSPLRQAAPRAAVTWISGNHDSRIHDYVKKYGYPLSALDALSMENLFELERFEVQYVKGPHRIGTNTYAVHGHESGGYCSSLSAWDLKFQKRYGSDGSYVFGHTHAPGLITRSTGYAGKVKPRFTLNVGSLMDPVQATYIKDGAVNWQMGFGVLRDDGKRVWPELVTFVDRIAYVSGKRY